MQFINNRGQSIISLWFRIHINNINHIYILKTETKGKIIHYPKGLKNEIIIHFDE